MKTTNIISVLTLLLVQPAALQAADAAAKTATDSAGPAVAPAASRYAVDRSGQRPAPVFTAPGHCAWPNLKLLRDGRTLAALIFNDASHGHHAGDIECWLSGDGGATWRFGSAATQHEPDTIRMNHAAGLAANGDLIVLTSGWSNRWPPDVPRTRGSYRYEVLGPWLSRSPDGGRSWWVYKDAFPQTTPSGQPAVPFGDLQIAGNGDLCVSVYSTQGPWEKYEQRQFRSFLVRSRDDGKTWGEPVVIGPDANETTVLHLGDGRWLAAARHGTGVEKKDYMVLCASADDGRTWTLRRTMTGFQRVNGHLVKLRDGRVLFCYGDRASDFGKRGLEAMLSGDGGQTWSEPVRLVDWNGLDGGYPSSVQRADGQVVTAYYCSALPGDPPNSYQNYHLAVIVWDPEQTFAQAPCQRVLLVRNEAGQTITVTPADFVKLPQAIVRDKIPQSDEEGAYEGVLLHELLRAAGVALSDPAAPEKKLQPLAQLRNRCPADTPVALVCDVTYPGEKVLRGELGTFADGVAKEKLPLLYLLYVGDSLGSGTKK